jgi:hypothetical protein
MGIPRAAMLLPRATAETANLGEWSFGDWLLVISGLLALFVVVTPLALDFFTRISWRRIFAIALLSWKEAIRGRVVWVFGLMALVFLFGDWFVAAHSPREQVGNYVRLVYWTMTPLFLITAALLGSFSIPTDVYNNSIHTIVTKPVEKFEIVLGRFFGYAALLTIGLAIVSIVSLLYVLRGVSTETSRESFRARVPIYGKIHYEGTKDAMRGDNVGREWTYRSYITGPTQRQPQALRQYAVWSFESVPAELGSREEWILFEFAFDIFRLSKGDEGKGVFCTFVFSDGTRSSRELPAALKEMHLERDPLLAAAAKKRDSVKAKAAEFVATFPDGDAARRKALREAIAKEYPKFGSTLDSWAEKLQRATGDSAKKAVEDFFTALLREYEAEVRAIHNQMAAKHRIFDKPGREITDEIADAQNIEVPPGLFDGISKQQREPGTPPLRAFCSVDMAREAQMVGVSRQDFYLLAFEKPFWQNFLKGVVGMWCTHMLMLAVSLACSTYLSSVISFVNTSLLFVFGYFVDYLREIADRRLDGGGPLESGMRITMQMPIAKKLDSSPGTSVVQFLDDVFSWWIGRILNVLPDVTRHDLHIYVANGFDISWADVLFLDNFVPLVGYLVPWAVFAYYLMKYREIANPS